MSSENPCARCGGKSIIRSVASYQDVRGGEIVDTRGEVRSRACPDCLLDADLDRRAFEVAAEALGFLESAYRKPAGGRGDSALSRLAHRNLVTSTHRTVGLWIEVSEIFALHGAHDEENRPFMLWLSSIFGPNGRICHLTKERLWSEADPAWRLWLAKRGTDSMRWFLVYDPDPTVRSAVAACGTHKQRVRLLHDEDGTVRGIARDRIDDDLP